MCIVKWSGLFYDVYENGPMEHRPRLYDSILKDHFSHNRQMAFVSGPRQVGKTNSCKAICTHYLNWDNINDRRLILQGPAAVAEQMQLNVLTEKKPLIVFDELHKQKMWRSNLKGFFDTYSDKTQIIVTGSSRLDVYRRAGDSLMGRYFIYRMHPWSVGEIARTSLPKTLVHKPEKIVEKEWKALYTHGGYPEPFLNRSTTFTTKWQSQRRELLIKSDIRDIADIKDIALLDVLSTILNERSSQQLIYSNLAKELGVSVDSVKRWIDLLNRMHYGFLIRPWFKNINKALRKEPKWFLRDWSTIESPGAKAETFVACHLLKAVECWNDLGFGHFELCYIRDKLKREVDFVITKDKRPWILIEVKKANDSLSKSLVHFQTVTQAEYAFQVVLDKPYVDADCFKSKTPTVVPARTLLSQLL